MPDISIINDEGIPARLNRCVGLYPSEAKRNYLGMSEIGDPCSRKLWLSYHSCHQIGFSNQILRIFDMGNIIEDRLVSHLLKAGYAIRNVQAEYSDFDGRLKGHCDGEISGLYESDQWHIIEIKSANQSSFNGFVKHGIQHNKLYGDKYFGQAQMYMHYSGLKRAVFVVENKNNSALYQERFRYDRGHALSLREKAETIITASQPPAGISRKVDYWLCRSCGYNTEDLCRKTWEGEDIF